MAKNETKSGTKSGTKISGKPKSNFKSNEFKVSKTLPKGDPNYLREQSKYDNPIASREYLLDLIERSANSLSFERIAKDINVKYEDQKEALIRRLKAMVRDGQLFIKLDKTYSTEPVEDKVIGCVCIKRSAPGYFKSFRS